VAVDPEIRFPGESAEYRRARNELLEAEIELRRSVELVAARRRALPVGGAVPEGYRFEDPNGETVRLSELFQAGRQTLAIYSFMFPRNSRDSRPGPANGELSALPLAETPCPSCTSILDSLDGAARHLAERLNLAVTTKADPQRLADFAAERGWRHLRLLSSRTNAYSRDYHAESDDSELLSMMNVFRRDGDAVRHTWASELMYVPREQGDGPRHVDSIWPIYGLLDMTPEGRGSGEEANFPGLRYE
jgi:predicted dithiol-disulfide oxidoreductase (DUF899 family)